MFVRSASVQMVVNEAVSMGLRHSNGVGSERGLGWWLAPGLSCGVVWAEGVSHVKMGSLVGNSPDDRWLACTSVQRPQPAWRWIVWRLFSREVLERMLSFAATEARRDTMREGKLGLFLSRWRRRRLAEKAKCSAEKV